MGERPLALVDARLKRDRDACEIQLVTATREVEVANARNEELRQELKACEADKLAAQKAMSDAHARARTTKDALALVERQSAVAASLLMQKETQLSQYSDYCFVFEQQTRDFEEQQKRVIEDAQHERSILKCEIEHLRKDVGQQDVLRSQMEKAREEANSLFGSLENARVKASTALSERDLIRRNLDEVRQRLVVAENEASVLRTEAFNAKANATSALAQLEDLQHELKEGDRFKNAFPENAVAVAALRTEAFCAKANATIAVAQLEDVSRQQKAQESKNAWREPAHTLQTQGGGAKNEAPAIINQVDLLPKEPDSIRKDDVTSILHRAEGMMVTSKHATSCALGFGEVQRKCAVTSSQTRSDIVVPGSGAVQPMARAEMAIDRLKCTESSNKGTIVRGSDLVLKELSQRYNGPNIVKMRSAPVKLREIKSICGIGEPKLGDLVGEKRQQHEQYHGQRQSKSQENEMRNTRNCPTLKPLQLSRTRSRLWGARCSSAVGKTKRRLRGFIYRSDLEKVGYTPGCPGCEMAINKSDQTKNHTEACRARIYAEMVRLDLPGARRLRNAEIETTCREPKRLRPSSLPVNSDASTSFRGTEVQQQVQVTQNTRTMITSIIRACAIK